MVTFNAPYSCVKSGIETQKYKFSLGIEKKLKTLFRMISLLNAFSKLHIDSYEVRTCPIIGIYHSS